MDYLHKDTYLEMPDDTLEVVRRDINMDKPGEMKEAVRILDEWVHQQPHFLRKDISPHYLEMTIVMAKGSIEQAKRVIDNMCTARTLMPEFFDRHDYKNDHKIFKEHFFLVALPKLTPEYYRISALKIKGKYDKETFGTLYKYAYTCIDYLKAFDYHCGIVMIIDLSECDIKNLMTNLNVWLPEVVTFFRTLIAGYGMRLKRFHVITPSKLIHTPLAFFKPFLSKKIFERVMINESFEELFQYYPKNILPKEYDGEEKSFSELQERVLKSISSKEYLEYIETMYETKIDKSLRPLCEFQNSIAINGTFRSLNID